MRISAYMYYIYADVVFAGTLYTIHIHLIKQIVDIKHCTLSFPINLINIEKTTWLLLGSFIIIAVFALNLKIHKFLHCIDVFCE